MKSNHFRFGTLEISGVYPEIKRLSQMMGKYVQGIIPDELYTMELGELCRAFIGSNGYASGFRTAKVLTMPETYRISLKSV